jgi:hypothetical protein
MLTQLIPLTLLLVGTMSPEPAGPNRASMQDTPPATYNKGTAVVYPWAFKKGTRTARTMAISTAEEIAQKVGFSTIPVDVAQAAWTKRKLPALTYRRNPSRASLQAYGRSLNAKRVVYGSVAWHTRSIWVNLGPKTISTATVDVYVLDVATGNILFQNTNVQGRSDEKSDALKVAGAILITPLVTAVSGGPATPQEQRAVQIALAQALNKWVNPNATN